MEEAQVLTNRCLMDERTLRQTYARIFRRTLLLFYCGAGLIAAFGLLLALLQGGLSPMTGILLVFAGVYLYLGLRQPKKQARRQIRRYEESGSDPNPEVTVWFQPEALTVRRGEMEPVEVPYDSLEAIFQDPGLIILWTRQKQYIVLDVNRFENGDEFDFWTLMRERSPRAMPKPR